MAPRQKTKYESFTEINAKTVPILQTDISYSSGARC